MRNFMAIRDEIYHHNLSEDGDLINFKSPYTLIKAVYYIETASIFLFITQAFIRSPNFITMLYVTAGVVGAFLLNSEQSTLFNLGVVLVFTKGTFDWADGPLARRLNKTSFIGHAFDEYGAYVSDAAFRLAFIYYTLGHFPELMYLFPIIAFMLLITKFSFFIDYLYFKNIVGNRLEDNDQSHNKEFEKAIKDPKEAPFLVKWYHRYVSFLDARARSIDFLLLILVIDRAFDDNLSEILVVLSLCLISRAIIMYAASIYSALKVYKVH